MQKPTLKEDQPRPAQPTLFEGREGKNLSDVFHSVFTDVRRQKPELKAFINLD